jgi:adenine/guanine/hypoxanthine permease
VKLGDLHSPSVLISLFGLGLTSILLSWRVPAAMLLGILGAAAMAWRTGEAQ